MVKIIDINFISHDQLSCNSNAPGLIPPSMHFPLQLHP